MAIKNVDELLKRSRPPQPTEKAIAAARRRNAPDAGTQYDENMVPIISWDAPAGSGDAMNGHGLIPSFKTAGLTGMAVRGAQKLVAPGKKLLSGAMDVQGMADTGGTIASNALDLSNLQRPSDYMKTIGKMQDAPQPVPSLPMPQLKLSSTRMAREGYGAMDRVMRFLNKQDAFVSEGQVSNLVNKMKKYVDYDAEGLAKLRNDAPAGINDNEWYPFMGVGEDGGAAYRKLPYVHRSGSFADLDNLNPNTARAADQARGQTARLVPPGNILHGAMKGHTEKIERGLRDRVSSRASERMNDLLQRSAGPNSLVRDPTFRGTESWDGHIGKSIRADTAQTQAKNRRTRKGTAARANARSSERMADTLNADLSDAIQRQLNHAAGKRP